MLKTFLLRSCLIALAALGGMGVALLCSPQKEKQPSNRPPMVHQPYTLFRNSGSQITSLKDLQEEEQDSTPAQDKEEGPSSKSQPPARLIKMLP